MITDRKQFQRSVLPSPTDWPHDRYNHKNNLVLRLESVWYIILKFIKQKWTLKGASKKNHPKWSRLDQEAQKLCQCQKQQMPLLKTNNLMVLRKFVNVSSNFPLEEIRHVVLTHQTSTEHDLQKKIVTHRIWQSTICHTYRHSRYFDQVTKVKSHHITLPLFKTNF
jgi:hypothetical protein